MTDPDPEFEAWRDSLTVDQKARQAAIQALADLEDAAPNNLMAMHVDTMLNAYLSALPEEVMFCPQCGWNSAMDGEALPAPDGLVERLCYHVENPSAWDTFDQGGSDLIAEGATALQFKAEQIERLTRERDEAFSANERDRSIVAEVRGAFNAALARRSWLLHGGRGSYEWDDDRWKDEFGQAVDELGAALEPLGKIGIDWSLCPTNPDEISAARIDWKARAEAAEQQVQKLTAENERLREAFKRLGKSDRQLVKDRSALTQEGER